MTDIPERWKDLWECDPLDDEFARYVRGKTVAIVAPGGSLAGSRQADEINSRDIVVRFNSALPVSDAIAEDSGTRCDVLCHCGNEAPGAGGVIDENLMRELGVAWFMFGQNYRFRKPQRWRSHEWPIVRRMMKVGISVHVIPRAMNNEIWDAVGTPNVGTCAIVSMMEHGAKEVYVAGMSYIPGYCKGYKENVSEIEMSRRHRGHDFEAQRDFIAAKYAGDPRLVGDPTFLNAIRNTGVEQCA